jgi:hypothetical protein
MGVGGILTPDILLKISPHYSALMVEDAQHDATGDVLLVRALGIGTREQHVSTPSFWRSRCVVAVVNIRQIESQSTPLSGGSGLFSGTWPHAVC